LLAGQRSVCRLDKPGINSNTFIDGKILAVELLEKSTIDFNHSVFGKALSKCSLSNNGGYFITITPKDRVQVKLFKKPLKEENVQWEKAFEVESTRKKGKSNIYKTYELQPDRKGFRNIFSIAVQSNWMMLYFEH